MNFDGENESFIAEFIWNNILIKCLSVSVENYKITRVVVVGGLHLA
jgi:hypothetical protein